jgi:hypothetical protein
MHLQIDPSWTIISWMDVEINLAEKYLIQIFLHIMSNLPVTVVQSNESLEKNIFLSN